MSDDLDELTKAEQRGYANAMEAERKLHEDRIEQLERENAEMAAAISDAENGGICSGGNLWRFWSRAAREVAHARADERSTAEAKLAKAVDIIKRILNAAPNAEDHAGWAQLLDDAADTLAELEKMK